MQGSAGRQLRTSLRAQLGQVSYPERLIDRTASHLLTWCGATREAFRLGRLPDNLPIMPDYDVAPAALQPVSCWNHDIKDGPDGHDAVGSVPQTVKGLAGQKDSPFSMPSQKAATGCIVAQAIREAAAPAPSRWPSRAGAAWKLSRLLLVPVLRSSSPSLPRGDTIRPRLGTRSGAEA